VNACYFLEKFVKETAPNSAQNYVTDKAILQKVFRSVARTVQDSGCCIYLKVFHTTQYNKWLL
jgi:hypothetical protein